MNNARISRLFDEIKRELETEERFTGRHGGLQYATQILPLDPQPEQSPRARTRTLTIRPHRVCRPYRLVFDPMPHSDWVVDRVDIGGNSLLPSARPVSVLAFTPLPPWMLDADPARMPDPEHLKKIREDWPLSNIEPITMQPGLELRVSCQYDGRDIVAGVSMPTDLPRAWLLAHVPEIW